MSDHTQLTPGLKVTGGEMKRTPILVFIITLLLVASMVLSGCQKPKTPSEELIAAVKKTYTFDTFEASANFTINIAIEGENPEDQAVKQLFNNSTLNLIQKYDQKGQRYQLDFNLLYKGQNCGSFILYTDLEKITLQSPFLGQKSICFNWEDSAAITSKYLNGAQIHIADYLPLLFSTLNEFQKASYAAYADFLAERVTANQEKILVTFAEEGKKNTFFCKEYTLDLGNDALEKDYQEFLVAIFENESVRTLLKEKIGEFVEIAKNNGDLKTWSWTEHEIRAFAENLDEYLNLMVENFSEEYASLESTTDQFESDCRILIDASGLLRNIVISQTLRLDEEESAIPGTVNTTIEMDMFNFGKQLAFTEFNPVGAFDAGKASKAEWMALGEEVMMNAIEQSMFNPFFQDIMLLSSMNEESEE